MLHVNRKNQCQKEIRWHEINMRLTQCSVLTVGGCACEIEGPQWLLNECSYLKDKLPLLMLAEASVFFKDIDTNDTPLFLLQKSRLH